MDDISLRIKSWSAGAIIPLDDMIDKNQMGIGLQLCSHCGRTFTNLADRFNHEVNCPVAGAERLENYIESIVRRVLREKGLTK